MVSEDMDFLVFFLNEQNEEGQFQAQFIETRLSGLESEQTGFLMIFVLNFLENLRNCVV